MQGTWESAAHRGNTYVRGWVLLTGPTDTLTLSPSPPSSTGLQHAVMCIRNANLQGASCMHGGPDEMRHQADGHACRPYHGV